MSWDESFADRYEEWSAPMTADIAFYVGLARAADGPLVELAIGNGRVAIPVARATGKPVIGIDSSAAMLAKARAGAAKAGVRLDLREGDMRDLALDEPAKATSTCSSPATGVPPGELPGLADGTRLEHRSMNHGLSAFPLERGGSSTGECGIRAYRAAGVPHPCASRHQADATRASRHTGEVGRKW